MSPLVRIAVLVGLVLATKRGRAWASELLRDASDLALAAFLRLTSSFGSELVDTGRTEQAAWRERRARDVRVRRSPGEPS